MGKGFGYTAALLPWLLVTACGGGSEVPETMIVAAPWGEVPERQLRVEFTADRLARFECRLDGGEYTRCTSPFRADDLPAGEHRFEVRAVNTSGEDPTPATAQWRIDPAPGEYPTGECPPLQTGDNAIVSAGGSRQFGLVLPAQPGGAPVVFIWHWLTGDPWSAIAASGLSAVPGIVLVAPAASGDAPYAWHSGEPANSNPDLALFDDLLTCLDRTFGIDRNRVWSTGFSAGALWNSYLLMHRASRLGAVSELSGGLPDPAMAATPYRVPEADVPVLLAWGGDRDVFIQPGAGFTFNDGDPDHFSFQRASLELTQRLRADGHVVMLCVGDYIHQSAPPDLFATIWPFLRDHPRGRSPEAYTAFGIADDVAAACGLS